MSVYTTITLVEQFLRIPAGNLSTKVLDIQEKINRIEDEIDKRVGMTWKTATENQRYYTAHATFDRDRFVIYLPKRKVQSVTVLTVFDGSTDINYLTDRTEGRDEDYWFDKEQGKVYIRDIAYQYIRRQNNIQIAYTYGYGATSGDRTAVPLDIERAATLMVAAEVVNVDDWTALLPGGEGVTLNASEKISIWRDEAEDILRRHKEITIGV